jgi:2-dehydropantoate 2-reductase
MRVLVAGAGAIGQFVGGRLHEAGHEVTLLTTPRHVEAFADGGLCVRGQTSYCWDPDAITSPAEATGAYDAILLTCKAYLTQHLGAEVAPLLGPRGFMLSLQNGLGNGEKLARIVDRERVAVALTSHGVTLVEPGLVRHAGEGQTVAGPGPGAPLATGESAHRLLADAGLAPRLSGSMRGPVWRKAIVNHAINPVAALHRASNGQVLDDADLRHLAIALLAEGEELARRARVELPAEDLREAMLATLERTKENQCSMLQDVLARRPTETEQITGRMVRLGETLLVDMPKSDAVYGRMKDLEGSYLGAEAATRLAWDELPWEKDAY